MGKKAKYAGSADLQKANRVIGVVYPPAVFDLQKWFVPEVEKQGGKIAPNAILQYTSNGTTVGDPSTAPEQAPTMVAKLKDLGVTSVVMFTDVEMGKAMTAQATRLEYQPEWIIAATRYQEPRPPFAVVRPESWAQTFGISNLFPYVKPADPTAPPRSTRCSGTTDEATARRARRAGRTSPGSWPVSSTRDPISR